MELNPGDLFVVTRGFELGDMSGFDAWLTGGIQTAPAQKHYDRSHEGRVYRVVEQCGPSIVGEIVYCYCPIPKFREVGVRLQINTEEVKIWPVTPQYLSALQAKGAT